MLTVVLGDRLLDHRAKPDAQCIANALSTLRGDALVFVVLVPGDLWTDTSRASDRSLSDHPFAIRAPDGAGISVLVARCDAAGGSAAKGRAFNNRDVGGRHKQGRPEGILGSEMALGETEEGWRRFIRQLKDRGFSGVELATNDAH